MRPTLRAPPRARLPFLDQAPPSCPPRPCPPSFSLLICFLPLPAPRPISLPFQPRPAPQPGPAARPAPRPGLPGTGCARVAAPRRPGSPLPGSGREGRAGPGASPPSASRRSAGGRGAGRLRAPVPPAVRGAQAAPGAGRMGCTVSLVCCEALEPGPPGGPPPPGSAPGSPPGPARGGCWEPGGPVRAERRRLLPQVGTAAAGGGVGGGQSQLTWDR